MMKIFKVITISLSLIIIITGCSKDWLDLDPQGKKLESNYFETEQELFSGLIAAYDILQLKYAPGWSSYIFMANFLSDDSRVVGGGPGDRPEYHELDQYLTTASNTAVLELWKRGYYGIYRAGLVINNDKAEGNLIDQYKAEAKFLRAYYYFELINFFGDVPLIIESLVPDEYEQVRAPKADVYVQIEKDLNEAINYLPNKSAQSDFDKGRVTIGAAQSLLGKVLLYQEKFSEAATVFQNVISTEGSEYGLVDDFDKIWRFEEENGIESIFEIQYTANAASGDWGNGRVNEGNIDVQMSGARSLNIDSLNSGWGFDMVDSNLVLVYLADDDTIRLNGTAYGEDWLISMGAGSWEVNDGYTGWFSKKRAPWEDEHGIGGDAAWNYGTNERVIRYADVKLMYAEALNRGRINDDEALNQVNDIRQRAKLDPLTDISDTDLFEAIKKERRLELAMEGFRFFDLIRWGDAAQTLGPMGFNPLIHIVLPIPELEILNTNGSLSQNNGY